MSRYIIVTGVIWLLCGCSVAPHPHSEIKAVEYTETIYLAQYKRQIVITTGRQFSVTETRGSAKTLAALTLTDDQIKKLASAFSKWHSLQQLYPGVADAPEASISYDGYTVTAGIGNNVPTSFLNVRELLGQIADAALATVPK